MFLEPPCDSKEGTTQSMCLPGGKNNKDPLRLDITDVNYLLVINFLSFSLLLTSPTGPLKCKNLMRGWMQRLFEYEIASTYEG